MLSARRQSNGQTVYAYFESKQNGPFYCLDCGDEVALKAGQKKADHFAHVYPLACEYGENESELHRRCKFEIFSALSSAPNATDVAMERRVDNVRPDVSAIINGARVAIEIQISSLSLETILARTIAYHQKGIAVLWLLVWTPELDKPRYAPRMWEKWVHACYFGRVYYWKQGGEVIEYSFEPCFRAIPKSTWLGRNGRKMTAGGYAERSVRFRTPIQGRTLNLTRHFAPQMRYWWEGGGLKVPDARLFAPKRVS